MALGSLVVQLGLDAAQFTAGLNKAEYQARQLGQSIGDGIGKAASLASTGLLAIGASAAGALSAFHALLDSASQFADLADKTGASAEALASFAVAAGTSGVAMDTIAGAANKLTQNLVGVDDESKAAGAALAALGIPMKDFKALKPDEQLEKVSKALGEFKDGAGKTAVAMAFFGKSGADLLPFLKTLEEQGGRQKILTDQQIAQADELLDRQAKLRAELGQYAIAIATQFITPTNTLISVAKDAAAELLNTGTAVNGLAVNDGVQRFAENAGRALAGMVDYVKTSVAELSALTDFVASTGKAVGQVAAFDFAGARKTGEEFRARYGLDELGRKVQIESGQQAARTFVDAYNAQLANTKRGVFAATDPRRVDLDTDGKVKDTRQDLNFAGAKEAGKKDTSAAQEAKARLHFDLDAIKNATDAITNAYGNQEKILEALRSAGLKDEEVYYAEKGRLLALNVAAQDNALVQQLARLKRESLSGKDQIENLKKIAGAEADLAKLRENAATSTQILGIQQTDALKKIADKFNAAEAAARAYVDAIANQNGRELAGMGQGGLQRDKDSRLAGRDDQLQSRRDSLLGQFTSGEITKAAYDKFLSIQETAHAQALESDAQYWEAKAALQSNWALGAQEGLKTYFEESQNLYSQVEKAGMKAFKGLEDQLVKFVMTGKADFKSLANSIIEDIVRITIRQSITGPIAGWLGGVLGGFTGQPSGRATGGNIQPNTLYRVNENGPELLDYNGKQYLMNGDKNGQITANGKFGGGGSGGGIEVVIQNNGAPATAEVQQSQNADGSMRIDVIMNAVKASVADDMVNRRGAIGRALGNGALRGAR